MEVSTSHPTPPTKQPAKYYQVQNKQEEQMRPLWKARDEDFDDDTQA